jgi:hypothetical protein
MLMITLDNVKFQLFLVYMYSTTHRWMNSNYSVLDVKLTFIGMPGNITILEACLTPTLDKQNTTITYLDCPGIIISCYF